MRIDCGRKPQYVVLSNFLKEVFEPVPDTQQALLLVSSSSSLLVSNFNLLYIHLRPPSRCVRRVVDVLVLHKMYDLRSRG